jgi:hypothetical protein
MIPQTHEPAYQLAAARIDILLNEVERVARDAHWPGDGDLILDHAHASRKELEPYLQQLQPENEEVDTYRHNIALIEFVSQGSTDDPSLGTLAYQIDQGDWCGNYRILDGADMRNEAFIAEALTDLGSEPGFFGIDQD